MACQQVGLRAGGHREKLWEGRPQEGEHHSHEGRGALARACFTFKGCSDIPKNVSHYIATASQVLCQGHREHPGRLLISLLLGIRLCRVRMIASADALADLTRPYFVVQLAPLTIAYSTSLPRHSIVQSSLMA